MVQHSSNFDFMVFDAGLQEIFYQQFPQVPQLLIGTVFQQLASQQAREVNRRVGSFGMPQPFNGAVHYTKADPDYEITFTPVHYTNGFKVEQELFEDNNTAGIFDSAAGLGQSFARKIVSDEASVFNNAFSGSYLGYDSKALVATDHPRSSTDSTAVNNSMGTVALTEANLESAILKLEGLGDDLGQTTNAMATHLIVGRENRKKAQELLGSPLNPETANNAINTFTNLQLIVHPFITSKKWFVVDAPYARRHLKWFNRILPTFGMDHDTSTTLVRSYFGRMRYSFGWTDFRWVVGSNAS